MTIDVATFRKLFPAIANHCDDAGLDALINAMSSQQVAAGKAVIREGEHSDGLYLVTGGTLTTSLEAGGKQLVMGTVTAGDSFCKTSLLDPGPAPMTVTADSDADLLQLSHAAFRELEQDHLDMTGNILRMLSDQLIELCRNADGKMFSRHVGSETRGTSGLREWAHNVYKALHGGEG